jgi:hypothetical protein
MQRFTIALVTAMIAGLLLVNAARAQWGTIKGQVTVTGILSELPLLVKKGDSAVKDSSICAAADIPDESRVINAQSNGLANVVISLTQKPVTIHPDLLRSKEPEVVLHQTGCKYVPHITIMRTDQKLRILNDDTAAHNQHLYAIKNAQFSVVVAPNNREGELVSYLTKAERLPLKIGCDIHPWMNGWVFLQDHPYVGVTNSNGEFEIVNLPIGQHEFRVWDEKAGYLEKACKITVKEGKNQLPALVYPVSLFK